MPMDRYGTAIAVNNTDFVAGMSPAMQSLESVVAEIAPTNIPVLVVGESGTGKQMFARLVHRLSRRSREPLLKIGCASLSPMNFSAQIGLAPQGNSTTASTQSGAGTFFFDEINELDAACQRLLLYALPDRDTAPRPGLITARVISTTTRNLDEEMCAGRFRRELYYRINGLCLRLPPLRERKEDIALLVEFFLTRHAADLGRPRPSLSPRTLRAFLDHSWPGNIRELENAVIKIVALGDEQLTIAELGVTPPETRMAEAVEVHVHSLKATARAASRGAERELILKTLARTRWNRKRAAQELQISYKSLLYKLKQIELQASETE